MSLTLNNLSALQSSFGDGSDSNFGGWTVSLDSLRLEDAADHEISTPGTTDLQVGTSFAVVVKAALDDWTPTTASTLASQHGAAGDRCWEFFVETNGRLSFTVSSDGTDTAVAEDLDWTSPLVDGQAHWLAVTYNATASLVTYWMSNDGRLWEWLGDDAAAVVTPFAVTEPIRIGARSAGQRSAGRFSYFALHGSSVFTATGPKGTLLTNWNADWHTGATATDYLNHTWTIGASNATLLPGANLTKGIGPYPAYTPDSAYKNTFQVHARDTANIIVHSPWVSVNQSSLYLSNALVTGIVADDEINATFDVDVRGEASGDGSRKSTSLPSVSFGGGATSYVSAENRPVFRVTGDVTVSGHLSMTSWTPGTEQPIGGLWGEDGQRAYALYVDTSSFLRLKVSDDGSTTHEFVSNTAMSTLVSNGHDFFVAAAVDIDDGASQRVCEFWTSPDGITWTLQHTDTDSGELSGIYASNADLEIARSGGASGSFLQGNVFSFNVYSGSAFTTAGPGGTEVAAWSADNHTVASAIDAHSNTWVINNFSTGSILFGSSTYALNTDYMSILSAPFTTGQSHILARFHYEFTDVAVNDFYVLYDPVIFDVSLENISDFSKRTYGYLPSFMRNDDSVIDALTGNTQPSYPLFRYASSLWSPMGDIADLAVDFDYVRSLDAVDGVESPSYLTDPLTANPLYFAWLAAVTGSTLISSATASTPWLALEEYNPDADATPGEWEDLQTLADWLAIQSLDPDFFDAVAGFRQQIETGFTGLNAGRPDAIVAYIRTLLNAVDSSSAVVVYGESDRDNSYKVKLLVDPGADPDASGTLLSDVAAYGLSTGASIRKVSQVDESGEGHPDIAGAFYPTTYSNVASGGVELYGKAFLNDTDGYARHFLMNDTANVHELGGGVGTAHYKDGNAFYYGVKRGTITSASAAALDFGGVAGYDFIFSLSDVTLPSAALDTAGDGGNNPPDWLYRTKRLLIRGLDSGSDNDWAIYLVSGATPGTDTDVRVMLVDGYNSSPPNYVVSGPIDLNNVLEGGELVLRVKRDGTDVTFYAQQTLHYDWENHIVSTHSGFTADSASGTGPYIQILGTMTGGNWTDADPLSCTINRVMLFNAPIVFDGSTATSAEVHAIVGNSESTAGDSVLDYGNFLYDPTADVDFEAVDTHTVTIPISMSDGTTVNATVTETTPNDNSLYMMRPLGGTTDVFLFSTTTNGASAGDTLQAQGLSAATTYYVYPTVVTDNSAGSTTQYEHSVVTDGSGNLDIAHDTIFTGSTTYDGAALTEIEVRDATGGGGSRVAYFLPSTMGASAGASAGVDVDATPWELTRVFPPDDTVGYVPSQQIDVPMVHPYQNQLHMPNGILLEVYHPFTLAIKVRRQWTDTVGVEHIITRLHDHPGGTNGFTLSYDGPYIKATFTDGTSTETVQWDETATIGSWHTVVVRRCACHGLSIVVDGDVDGVVSTDAVVFETFTSPTGECHLADGEGGAYNGRFGISDWVFFERTLSDEAITLLHSQIS